MKIESSINPHIKIIIWIAVLMILGVISIRSTIPIKEAGDKNRTAVVVDEPFSVDVSSEPEQGDFRPSSKIASIKRDNKTDMEDVGPIDQEAQIFERNESENGSTEGFPHHIAEGEFLELHEPFLQGIGVSQNTIEEIYDLYMRATKEIMNIHASLLFLEDLEEMEEIMADYNDDVMAVLGETDGERYEFFKESFTERVLTNKLNANLDKENQLDDDQLEELTKDFYNIRAKYYDVEYRVGSGIRVSGKFEGDQTPEEINARIKYEYIGAAENNLTETQLGMLKNILGGADETGADLHS
jgi:hypothetical protein